MKAALAILFIALWIFVLRALKKAKLQWWYFLVGSMGLFILMMVFVRPIATQPLARVVSGMAGVVGSIGDTFTAYYKYGIIFIRTATGSLTLTVDFECSGIIEIMAYLSLLLFFDVYTPVEKAIVGISGFAAIMLFNAMRIVIICLSVHFFGIEAYHVTHTIIGRLFFYAFSVLLYFYVFTKPQIIKMKVGSFSYEHSKQDI